MLFIFLLFMLVFVMGMVGVASNPSPSFAALGLAVTAIGGCGVLMGHGGLLVGLMLALIYLGGMLVVFAFSVALAAEPFPESWVDSPVKGSLWKYSLLVVAAWFFYGSAEGWVVLDELQEFSVVRGDIAGISMMYSVGGGMLLVCAFALLLCLFVVLELTRGSGSGSLRAI